MHLLMVHIAKIVHLIQVLRPLVHLNQLVLEIEVVLLTLQDPFIASQVLVAVVDIVVEVAIRTVVIVHTIAAISKGFTMEEAITIK